MYSIRIYALYKVVNYYDLGDLSMSVMGFQNKLDGRWVGGVSSIQVYFGFFNFAKPLTSPIISSLADYMVPSQGPLPSPITDLDQTAEGYGKECVTYLMMTPGGEMMCRDATGKIIATTVEELLLSGNMVSVT